MELRLAPKYLTFKNFNHDFSVKEQQIHRRFPMCLSDVSALLYDSLFFSANDVCITSMSEVTDRLMGYKIL